MFTVEKVESVDTWSRYEIAPVDAFHRSVGVREMPVAPFSGERRAGVAGPATSVLKRQTGE